MLQGMGTPVDIGAISGTLVQLSFADELVLSPDERECLKQVILDVLRGPEYAGHWRERRQEALAEAYRSLRNVAALHCRLEQLRASPKRWTTLVDQIDDDDDLDRVLLGVILMERWGLVQPVGESQLRRDVQAGLAECRRFR